MNTKTAILAAGLVAGGMVGAAWLARPTESPNKAAEAAALQDRLLELEARAAQFEASRDEAWRVADRALKSTQALDARLRQVERQGDGLMALLSDDPAGARSAAAGRATAAGEGGGEADVLAALAHSPRAAGDELAFGVGAPVEPTPAQRALVQKALADIRAQEEEEQRVQREERQRDRLTQRVDLLSERLALQPHQREGLERVYQESFAQRMAVMTAMRDGTLERAEVRTEMERLRTVETEALASVLTPNQVAELERIEAEEREQRGGGDFFGGGRGGAR